MKLRLMAAAALTGALAAGSAAQAQDVGDWYVGFDFGAAKPDDWSATSTKTLFQPATSVSNGGTSGTVANNYQTVAGVEANVAIDVKQDRGSMGMARVGFRGGENLRFEIEASRLTNDVVSAVSTAGPRNAAVAATTATAAQPIALPAVAEGARFDLRGRLSNVSGELAATTAMVNVLYDFAPDSRISPFVGIGLGAAQVDVTLTGTYARVVGAAGAAVSDVPTVGDKSVTGFNADATSGFRIDHSNRSLAYQAILGTSFKPADRITIDLTYRYVGLQGFKVRADGFGPGMAAGSAAVAAGADLDPEAFKGSRSHQAITLGFRFAFYG